MILDERLHKLASVEKYLRQHHICLKVKDRRNAKEIVELEKFVSTVLFNERLNELKQKKQKQKKEKA